MEQFDAPSPQLTVRETVLFSARLRLDVEKDEDKCAFVDEVLKTLELTPLADVLVGSPEEGGLSFEQIKRLSIAVELAASPSILFLDQVSHCRLEAEGKTQCRFSQNISYAAKANFGVGRSKCVIGGQTPSKNC